MKCKQFKIGDVVVDNWGRLMGRVVGFKFSKDRLGILPGLHYVEVATSRRQRKNRRPIGAVSLSGDRRVVRYLVNAFNVHKLTTQVT